MAVGERVSSGRSSTNAQMNTHMFIQICANHMGLFSFLGYLLFLAYLKGYRTTAILGVSAFKQTPRCEKTRVCLVIKITNHISHMRQQKQHDIFPPPDLLFILIIIIIFDWVLIFTKSKTSARRAWSTFTWSTPTRPQRFERSPWRAWDGWSPPSPAAGSLEASVRSVHVAHSYGDHR